MGQLWSDNRGQRNHRDEPVLANEWYDGHLRRANRRLLLCAMVFAVLFALVIFL